MSSADSSNYCTQCGSELLPNSHFCSNCGTQISFKDKLSGLKERLRYKTKNTIDTIKNNLDSQISDYLKKFENNEEVTIGAVRVPDSRRSGVMNAMRSFQNKYLGGNPEQSADYQEWLSNLSNRLEDHKCIVCFTSWSVTDQDDIVVCPHCQTGGHRSHIENWIKSNGYCPLCRENVRFTEFINIV